MAEFKKISYIAITNDEKTGSYNNAGDFYLQYCGVPVDV